MKEQQEGLPIGLDLTRAVARLVLLDWDQQFLRMVRTNNITCHLYYRYMDDTSNGMEALRPGTRWNDEEKRMMLHPPFQLQEYQTDMWRCRFDILT